MSNTPTFRIFLSSTAIDMVDYREKVSTAIQRMNSVPVRMEVFGAIPNKPLDECKTRVSEADAMVVMIAHRYGWVPSIELGGDGEKSITQIEVECALENEIPVFAFIVDEQYQWNNATEQDQLKTAKDETEALLVFKRIQSLQKFKELLNTKVVCDKFSSADDLATKVVTSLSNWRPVRASPKISAVKRRPFVFRMVHHLQPAPFFRGREKLLKELKEWWLEPVTPDRVRSLVAIGGTGKTAIVEQFLQSISKQELRGSVLVWSFYDEPNTDAFLREACLVFTGELPEGEGGKLQRLTTALNSENYQNLIVLDGLERVQSEGKAGRAKGDLEEHQLKNLLRSIAAGLGNTRTLITTRFKLNDLAQWENAGYKSHDLEILDKVSAIEVLKAWQIMGDDKVLNNIAESVGRHALSVSVLGSYLNHYCACDPECVKEFKLDEFTADDTQAAKLARILGGYAKSLPNQERDLIIRLSVFPKGVSIDILAYVVNAGGEIAGALIDVNQHKLSIIAERLKQQGLIYSYKKENTIYYTAHPFLREYFRELLGVKPEDIHEAIMNKLANGLDTKPDNKPRDVIVLDKYEQLIEHSILAGHIHDAWDLYLNVMGGEAGRSHLYHKLGDYARMIRVCTMFSKDGNHSEIFKQLDENEKANILNLWGLAVSALGDLSNAYSCFYDAMSFNSSKENSGRKLAQDLQNLGWIYLQKGNIPLSIDYLNQSLKKIKIQNFELENTKYILRSSNSIIAYCYFLLGNSDLARLHFNLAKEVYKKILTSLSSFFENKHFIALGEHELAYKNLISLLNVENTIPRDKCYYQILLGLLSLDESISESTDYLNQGRLWTEKSGHMECILELHILASEIEYKKENYELAISEATMGLNQAESCGFGIHRIDLLLLLAKIHIAIPDYKTALSYARKAMDLSAEPECGYAWGEANGAHFCGICHKALGEYELARQRLTTALNLREKIEHPNREETRKLLESLPIK